MEEGPVTVLRILAEGRGFMLCLVSVMAGFFMVVS